MEAKRKCRRWGRGSVRTRQNIAAGKPQKKEAEAVSSSLNDTPEETRCIANIDDWKSAFSIYTAIYGEKYPHQYMDLMAYGEEIDNLSKREGFDIEYDERRRYHMCINRKLNWKDFDADLLDNVREDLKSTKGLNAPQRPAFWYEACWDYNEGRSVTCPNARNFTGASSVIRSTQQLSAALGLRTARLFWPPNLIE